MSKSQKCQALPVIYQTHKKGKQLRISITTLEPDENPFKPQRNRKLLPKYLHHFNSFYLYTLIDADPDTGL